MQRDVEVNQELTAMGYTVFRFWETEVKKNLQECLAKTIHHLNTVQMSQK